MVAHHLQGGGGGELMPGSAPATSLVPDHRDRYAGPARRSRRPAGAHPMIDHHRCPPDAHDRDPGTARIDGAPVDEQGLLLCRDCYAPLMFCATIHDYVHVDPATAPCFLVPGSALDLVVRIQGEITEDVADGIVPAAVSS